MTLAQFTEPKLLVPRLLSNHRESAIIELSRRLKSAGRIENADSFVDAAMDHESIASAVFDGVTFPLALWSSTVRQPGRGDTAYSTGRARGRAVKELSFAAGLSRQGIRWGAGRSPCGVGVCASSGGLPCFTPRGEPVVHTVVLFAVPLAEGQTYLSLVVTFSSFMKDETAFSALRRCVRPEAMLNVLEQVLALWSSTVRQPGGGDTAYSTGRVLWSSSSCLLWYLRQPLLHGAKDRDVWSPESFRGSLKLPTTEILRALGISTSKRIMRWAA